MAKVYLKNKKIDMKKLDSFGFSKADGDFLYTKSIVGGEMTAKVTVNPNGEMHLDVFDTNGEEYTLHNVPSAAGAFVGKVRGECEELIEEILKNCSFEEIYKWEQTKKVLEYAKERYAGEPEFLWERFPDCSAIRRSDNKKWYAAILKVSRRKLGQDSDERAEILDLRIDPGEVESTVDSINFFPGYHMNKKHWITIVLDGSLDINTIYNRIDLSYELAKK